VVRLRDRATIAVMSFTFVRVSGVGELKMEDYIRRKKAGGFGCARKTTRSMKCLSS
jgi:hypothetical protein